ncbi:hypothetical protein Tco_0853894 [Tanacetum coccineum]
MKFTLSLTKLMLDIKNFEIQFLKKAAKFVRDFKSLANEVDESLAKHKALEFEIERLLRAVVSQDIMSIVQNPTVIPKVGELNALSNPVTSNSTPFTQESKVMKNDNVIATRMFRINHSKTSRVDNDMPKKLVKASVSTNPIIVSQPPVIPQENVNSNSNGISSTGVESTVKTRRPQL